MKAPKKTQDENFYQLKITLVGSKPVIWRRLIVPADLRLDRLHLAIQDVMGWENCHLHDFRAQGEVYGSPDQENDLDIENENKFRLNQISQEGDTFTYDYDFGDSWEHDIEVEKILPADSHPKQVACTGGKNACPPEDCGGIFGYYDLLKAIKNPKNEEHESMREWIGEDFDPAVFDIEAVNAKLRKLKV